MPRKVLIKVRRGTEAQLNSIILADGELGITTDTKKLFIGISGVNVLLVNTSDVGGDMLKSIYDTNNDGVVDLAKTVVGPVTWNQLKGV
jgi:hypothetical protein